MVEVGKHWLPEDKYAHVLASYVAALHNHRSVFVGVVLLVILAGACGLLVVQHKADRTAAAWKTLAAMESADELDLTAKSVSGTAAEPFFVLKAGRILFERREQGDIDKAQELYGRFASRWPNHPIASYMDQSLGYVLEEKKQYEEALKIFSSLVEKGGYMKKQSLWDAGRCAEKAGRKDKAMEYYARLAEDADSGRSPWARYGETRLAELKTDVN